jgi:hypothetical protein
MLLFIFSPLVVTPTTPLPPPYHEFNVRGNVERSGGGSVEGLGVVLLVKRNLGLPDSLKTFEIFTPRGNEWQLGSRYFVFTDALGEFALIVRSNAYIDSISAAVILPNDVVVTGDTLRVDEMQVLEHAREVQTTDGGCCENPSSTQVPSRLQYIIPRQTITIP